MDFLARANALMNARRPREAIALYRQALRLAPDAALIHYNLGNALAATGALADAITAYRRAVRRQPGFPAAHANLGNALWDLGRREAAIEHVKQAIALDPNFAGSYVNLGKMLGVLGRVAEGLTYLRRGVEMAPNNAEAWFTLGHALLAADLDTPEALAEYFKRAIALNPRHAAAHVGLGQVVRQFKSGDAALALFDRAIELDPGLAWAHTLRGSALSERGRLEEARASFAKAIELEPDNPVHRLRATIAEVPALYDEEPQIETCRARYAAALDGLSRFYATSKTPPRDLAASIGAAEPFFLAYQARNDRELQARYGTMVHRVMAAAFPGKERARAVSAAGEPIRVAIVSNGFRSRGAWRIPMQGWVEGLDRSRFRLFAYHTGRGDGETEKMKPLFDRYVENQPSIEDWLRQAEADALQVAIFPELGMDGVALQLAALRLAPVQCTTLGNPQTSGLPTVDYFLGGELMEPEDAALHYTEELVKLPNLGIAYEPPPVADALLADRSSFGIRPDAVAFWCWQSTFKYLPQYDIVFPRIAAAVGNAQFVFAADKSEMMTEQFRRRLDAAFSRLGLSADRHVLILPRLPPAEYHQARALCDVFLDSIGYSGFNTTLESLSVPLPVVTWPSSMSRGRQSYAVLKMLGVEDTVARSLDDYVTIAVGLATDAAWRDRLRTRIAANRDRLYHDQAPVRALETWLESVARNR
jgi:protein O-GlcNAc transferase